MQPSEILTDILKSISQLSAAFNNAIAWLLSAVLHVTIPTQAINIISILIVGVCLWKFLKRIPLIIGVLLGFFVVFQLLGVFSW